MAGAQVIELLGSQKIANDLRTMADRMMTPTMIFETEMAILEQAEREIFASHGGKYVNTGQLMESLTQTDAEGAIRRAHGAYGVIEFGTSIWYAKFQRRIDGPSGKPRGRKRYGPNQVLRITPTARREAAAVVRQYLFGDYFSEGGRL